MKNLAVPTLLAAVVAAAVAMFMPRSDSGGTAPTAPGLTAADVTRLLAGYKKNPPSTTLTLYKDTSTTCKAEVDSDPVGNLPEKKVFWYVINEDCPLKEAHPKVKLVFTPVKDQYPFTKKEVESKRQNDLVYVHEKIKKFGQNQETEVQYGKYPYKVYLLNGMTHDPSVPVLDPDLEVEDGGVVLTPGGVPPPPPPKKQ